MKYPPISMYTYTLTTSDLFVYSIITHVYMVVYRNYLLFSSQSLFYREDTIFAHYDKSVLCFIPFAFSDPSYPQGRISFQQNALDKICAYISLRSKKKVYNPIGKIRISV